MACLYVWSDTKKTLWTEFILKLSLQIVLSPNIYCYEARKKVKWKGYTEWLLLEIYIAVVDRSPTAA